MGRVYAIDLGVTGAIATFDSGHLLAVDDLVITGGALCADWLTDYIAGVQRDTIVCESVHAMPTGTKANFSMGLQLGVVIVVAGALDTPLSRILPREWKKRVGITKVGRDSKDQARQIVAQQYPGFAPHVARVKDHNRAEAILIGKGFLQNESH